MGTNEVTRTKRCTQIVILFLFLGFIVTRTFANNITVSNVALKGQNKVLDYTLVQFDISWNNSWRVSTGPSNWDAAWVFVKYRLKTQTTWNHATLNWVNGTGSGDGHTEPTNSDINSSNDNAANGAYGVFIRRNADMAQANVNYTGVQLRWNYGVDGLTDADLVEIRVFAIEMVYVPQGSFYVGDGSVTTIRGQFESGTTGAAKQITSEAAITLGGGGAGSLGNNNKSGMNTTAENFDDVTSLTLSAAFPKGYNAFYCMKYEISQGQYVVFLNTLTYTQQTTRTAVAPNSVAGTGALSNTFRNGIDIKTPGVSATTPAVYACNLDGDTNYDEAADGGNIACNFICWADLAAYLDWAALRPMTELEFEKAARGTLAPVADEYAWGSKAAFTGATGISNSGLSNETASNAGAICVYNSVAGVQGPMRVGNLGQGVNTRIGVGASYYGILDLSGNVYERTISVGKINGQAFTGVNGNGAIDATGIANVTNWPVTGSGANFRGGGWDFSSVYLRVSDRIYAAEANSSRTSRDGGRGVRCAP